MRKGHLTEKAPNEAGALGLAAHAHRALQWERSTRVTDQRVAMRVVVRAPLSLHACRGAPLRALTHKRRPQHDHRLTVARGQLNLGLACDNGRKQPESAARAEATAACGS